MIGLKNDKKISYVESQSGFDGRILLEKPYLAKMLKEAGFKNPRIAWEHSYYQHNTIKKQVDVLTDAGFRSNDISIFMIYNYFMLDYVEMEKKRVKCAEWGVQISDCRYRPLDQKYDWYNGHKKHQTKYDYYIAPNWTDYEVRLFRKNVRRHNQCIRHRLPLQCLRTVPVFSWYKDCFRSLYCFLL